jgi:3-oxoacyl-[acyl-carrier protein] reductase
MRLDDKVVLVTGGGSGIGASICRAMAAEGASVAVLDVREDAAKQVAAELERAVAVAADVSDSASVDAAVERVVAELGHLDVLVNNAGIASSGEHVRFVSRAEAQLAEMAEGAVTTALDATVRLTDDEWRRMLATHLDGTFYCTRAALRHMAPRGSGSIVNIASICGIEGCTGSAHYSAAKAGILGFTRAVAKEVILQGVRVNAIAPGYVDTPLLDVLTEPLRAATVMQIPMGRMGRPEEIAATAVFLASDEASFFVGETLSPNGGHVTI